MKLLVAVCLLSLTVCIGNAQDADCGEAYKEMVPTHTRCKPDYPFATAVTLTQAEKDEIVSLHNYYRAEINDAGNMLQVAWHNELAKTAEKWAMQCTFGHDTNRNEPNLTEPVGQNQASAWGSMIQYNFSTAIEQWHSEIQNFTYGVWTGESGHFIQEINALTQFVGCGAANCTYPNSAKQPHKFLVCNYFPTAYSNWPPYAKGEPCDHCPNHCGTVDGKKICQCGNPPCMHGKVDPKTCKCVCNKLYSGDACESTFCPNNTVTYYNWCPWLNPTTDCATNVYKESCPVQCKHAFCGGK